MANIRTFSVSEAFKYGWRTTLKDFPFFLVLLIITFSINFLLGYIENILFKSNEGMSGVVALFVLLVRWIVSLELSFAMIAIVLRFVDKKKSEISDLFAFFDIKTLYRFFLISFLYSLMVIVGTILFVVPGIYFSVKYAFAPYIFVDKGGGVFDAFSKSAEITRGVKWKLFVFEILIALVMLAGVLALGVGLVLSYPTVFLAEVYVYKKLMSGD